MFSHSSFPVFCAAVAAALCFPSVVCGRDGTVVPSRRYYAAGDTVVCVPADASYFAVELRASLPGMKEGRGCSADRVGLTDGAGQWAMLCGFNSDYGSELDRRGLRLVYGHTDVGGRTVAIDSVDVYDDVNTMRGFNTLALEWSRTESGARLDMFVGSKQPRLVMSVAAPMPEEPVRISGHGRREVETLMTEWSKDPRDALFTGWTQEALDERFSHSTDAVEGYWSYFDRRTDDDRARIGGKYRLAIVGNGSPGGYDILYADGAVTGAGLWRKAMLKGRMTASRFEHMWQIEWYDANGDLLVDDEAYATLSLPAGVLSVEFPLYRSRIRFAKD